MTALIEARDAVFKVVTDAWLADPLSSAILMTYQNVRADKPGEDGATTDAASWARTSFQIIEAGQSTQGIRRFETTGIVTVQIFTQVGDGGTLGHQLAQVVLDALRAKANSSSGLWFFDQAPNEIGTDGPWAQINVSASFRFQEVVS